jgi:1-aminocyclopropane-1-carboxylate deaminase/D-cysteine desulfhydrase-like pyridoxal-dependent ACC family enzyme
VTVHEPRQHDAGVGCACGKEWPCEQWLTPVERRGDLWLKRDDAFAFAGHRGGKVRTCRAIARVAASNGLTRLVTAGSRHSPQVAMVAAVAAAYGLQAECHVPAGPITPELEQAIAAGAQLRVHRPGHNSVIVARANEAAKQPGAALVPFGMECQQAIDLTAAQVANLPSGYPSLVPGHTWPNRLVVSVGSGMSLAGILHGLADWPGNLLVLGVAVGAGVHRRLDRWAPLWPYRADLRHALAPYSTHVDAPAWPDWAGQPVALDPVYEAKVVPYLLPGDLLWVVGRRAG